MRARADLLDLCAHARRESHYRRGFLEWRLLWSTSCVCVRGYDECLFCMRMCVCVKKKG